MSIEIRHFKPGDCGQIESRHPVKTDRDAYHYEGMEEFSWTMLEDGKPIAAWGMQPHEEGVATVWSDFSARALTQYPVAVAKNVKRRLEEHIKKLRQEIDRRGEHRAVGIRTRHPGGPRVGSPRSR